MDRGRDRLLLWILSAHLPLGLLVAFLHGTSSSIAQLLGETAIIPVLSVIAYVRLAGTRAIRSVGAALLIHLGGGPSRRLKAVSR